MKKILVVDDEELLTRTFAKLLEKSGYEAWTASNPHDAVAMVEEEEFDLIISDMRMPGMNGVEVIEKIQADRLKLKKIKIPVIFLTGYADQKLEDHARQLNPIAYVYKPFDALELLTIVNKELHK